MEDIASPPNSSRSLFGDLVAPEDVMPMVGRGAASRMFANGKLPERDLTAVSQFFQPGATLSNCTAFAHSSMAKSKNAPVSPRTGTPPRTAAEEAGAEDEAPVNEMQFFNIGGARVYFYYGLDTIRAAKTIQAAGPHVRDTAIGVLMLDQYKIQERPGDPSNPFSFWPYQAIYAVPQGIPFAACKAVGSSGAQAGEKYPLLVASICQALMGLCEVAARVGYRRLFICADCGYFALAAAAYSRQLLCWGKQSWAPHPEGPFAAFRCPRFVCAALDLEIVMCLGTTQLIADPSSERNLAGGLHGGASVVYVTADTCGWYAGDAAIPPHIAPTHPDVAAAFAPYIQRPWLKDGWHISFEEEISMLDVVVRANDALLEGVALRDDAMHDKVLDNVTERMLEFSSGSTAYLVGLWLGDAAAALSGKPVWDGAVAAVWTGAATSVLPLALRVARAADGATPTAKDAIVDACAPFFEYMAPLLREIVRAKTRRAEQPPLSETQEWRAFAALLGDPSGCDPSQGMKKLPSPTSYAEMKLYIALRVQDTLLSLLAIGEVARGAAYSAISHAMLPLGASYVDVITDFHVHLNADVIDKIECGSAINGRNFLLFDVRHTPGFGIHVGFGLTIWTAAKNYL